MYVRGLLIPGLFGLLVSVTIRMHSLNPAATMTGTVGYLMAVAAIAFLLLLALGRAITIGPYVAVLLLALISSTLVSVLGSGDIELSQQRLQLYVAILLVGVAVYVAYRDADGIPLASFGIAISLVHMPFLFAGILWIAADAQPFWEHGPRLAHFAHVRQFAEAAFFAAVGATAAGVQYSRLFVPALLLAAAAIFGIVMTGSRGALLSWFVFAVLMCIIGPARLRALIHGVLALAIGAGLVWQLDRSGQFPSPNIFERIDSLVKGSESFDSDRLVIWGQSAKQILARPLFGSGPEGYWISGCCERHILQAHNFVLQFLMEFGLVGCMLAIFLLSSAVRGLGGIANTRRLLLATPANRGLAGVLVAFFVYSLIDQTMYHLIPLLHFALFAGLLGAGLAQARASSVKAGLPQVVNVHSAP